MKMKNTGVQLFGLFASTAYSNEEILDRLSKSGYELVEPCVSVERVKAFPRVWTAKELEKMVPEAAKRGMKIESAHLFFSDYEAHWEVIGRMRQLGVKFFVVNLPSEVTREVYEPLAEKFSRLAERLETLDAQLLVHNNYAEIAGKIDGKTGYEWLLDACGGLVKAQPDVGWVLFGGQDPLEFLSRNVDRLALLHLKDVRYVLGQGEANASSVQLGTGRLNTEAMIRFGKAHHLPLIVDQDNSREDLLQDLEACAPLLA